MAGFLLRKEKGIRRSIKALQPVWFSAVFFFWIPLCFCGAILYFELLRRFSELPPRLANEMGVLGGITPYRNAGEAIIAGDIPYRDFFIEYPPGSLPFFVPPALFTESGEAYGAFFASEMALVLVVTLMLMAYAARALGRPWPLAVAVFTAGALLLSPVAVARYDAVVALSFAASLAVISGDHIGRTPGRTRTALTAAWASLGFGAAAKLVPALATLPLALLLGRREGTRKLSEVAWDVARGFAVFFSVVAAFFLPALLFGGGGLAKSFTYHADRGLQVESLAASVLMKLGWVEGTVHESCAMDVRGWGVDLISSMSLPITAVLLVVTAVLAVRQYRQDRFGPGEFPRFAAAFVLAFLLGSKVLSPQFVIWILPLMPLSARGIWGLGISTLFLLTCWMTTLIYPYHYAEIMNVQSPGTDILLGRNLLLVVLWGLILFIPSRGKLTVESRSHSNRSEGKSNQSPSSSFT